jgi:tetratricopeptide (TPR) repeat protein
VDSVNFSARVSWTDGAATSQKFSRQAFLKVSGPSTKSRNFCPRNFLSEPDNSDRLNTLGLAKVRNGMWAEAIATLKKATALHAESEPEDFLFLALAYQGHGDAVDADSNYERAVKLLGDVDVADPVDVSLWRETAAALGKPAPPSPKKFPSAGTR